MGKMKKFMVVHRNPDLWGGKWEEHLKAEETADTRGF
jgi:hypothetical protein